MKILAIADEESNWRGLILLFPVEIWIPDICPFLLHLPLRLFFMCMEIMMINTKKFPQMAVSALTIRYMSMKVCVFWGWEVLCGTSRETASIRKEK